MTIRGVGATGWFKTVVAVAGLCVSLIILWSMLAKPAVSEAARAEAKVVTDAISVQLDVERVERKEADKRNDTEHAQMQTRLDSRLSQIEQTQGDQTKLILELLRRTPK